MATSVSVSAAAPLPTSGARTPVQPSPSEGTGRPVEGKSVMELGRAVAVARTESLPSVHEVSKISRESVEAAAEKIQSFVSSMKRDLNIYVDNSTGRSVIRVVDPDSSQVIRQIPPEESIRLAQTVDFLASLLVHQRA